MSAPRTDNVYTGKFDREFFEPRLWLLQTQIDEMQEHLQHEEFDKINGELGDLLAIAREILLQQRIEPELITYLRARKREANRKLIMEKYDKLWEDYKRNKV